MVNGLDVTGCGNRLFTGDSKGQIRCWDRHHNKQDDTGNLKMRIVAIYTKFNPAKLCEIEKLFEK